MGITFLLAIDGCRVTSGNDSLGNLKDKLPNKGHVSNAIKLSTCCLLKYYVGGGEDPPGGGIPYN